MKPNKNIWNYSEDKDISKCFEKDNSALTLEVTNVRDGYKCSGSSLFDWRPGDPTWINKSYDIFGLHFRTKLNDYILESRLVSLVIPEQHVVGPSWKKNYPEEYEPYFKFMELVYIGMNKKTVLDDLRDLFISKSTPLIRGSGINGVSVPLDEDEAYGPRDDLLLSLFYDIRSTDFEGTPMNEVIDKKIENVGGVIGSLCKNKRALTKSLELLPGNAELEARLIETEGSLLHHRKIKSNLRRDLTKHRREISDSDDSKKWLIEAGKYVTSFFPPEVIAVLPYDSVRFKRAINRLYHNPRSEKADTRKRIFPFRVRLAFDTIQDVVKKSISDYTLPKISKPFEEKMLESYEKHHDLREAQEIILQYVPIDCCNELLNILQKNYDCWKNSWKIVEAKPTLSS